MTGDQRHRNNITNGQHLNRHADRPYVFYFFSTAQKILNYRVITNTFKNNSDVSKFSQRTIGTFASRIPLQAGQKTQISEAILEHLNNKMISEKLTYPTKTDNKGEKSYFNRLKFELN